MQNQDVGVFDWQYFHGVGTICIVQQIFGIPLGIKVACTSGPFSSKIMDGYPIFHVQAIDHHVDKIHK